MFLHHVGMQDAQVLCVFHGARICIHLRWSCEHLLSFTFTFSICVAQVNQPENLFVQTKQLSQNQVSLPRPR